MKDDAGATTVDGCDFGDCELFHGSGIERLLNDDAGTAAIDSSGLDGRELFHEGLIRRV